MSIDIQWINHASFRIADADNVLYIDPWKLSDAPHDADIVIVSHDHHDHCSPKDIAGVSANDTTVIAPASTASLLGYAVAVALAPGKSLTVKNIIIDAIPAYNVDKKFHPRDNNWIGVVIEMDGKRIYYAGDTDLIGEMDALRAIDLALLPIGGTYTLDADQAAQACLRIGCKAAIGYHWGDIVGSQDDAEKFAAAANCKVHLLQPGQNITL